MKQIIGIQCVGSLIRSILFTMMHLSPAIASLRMQSLAGQTKLMGATAQSSNLIGASVLLAGDMLVTDAIFDDQGMAL